MNVLVLTDLYPPFPGGAEAQIGHYARFLMHQCETVRVLTGYEAAKQFDGPPVEHEAIGIGADHDAGWALIERHLNLWDPDVVLVHHLYARIFSKELEACGIPVVQIVLNGSRLEFAALAVFISEWVRGQAGNARPDDLTILPPAFSDVIAETHGDCIGFIKPIKHKGVELVYRIAAAMPDRKFLVLRGEWQDLELLTDLPNVEYMEPVEDMRTFYERCRLVLMPSLSEDAGSPGFECALNGIPCISSNVGGLAETNRGGCQLMTHDVAEWVRTIRDLDAPWSYKAIVQCQSDYLASIDQDSQIAEFHKRLVALV